MAAPSSKIDLIEHGNLAAVLTVADAGLDSGRQHPPGAPDEDHDSAPYFLQAERSGVATFVRLTRTPHTWLNGGVRNGRGQRDFGLPRVEARVLDHDRER
jgi:hypothetical protein